MDLKKYSQTVLNKRVLVAGCLPPPMGGIASYFEALLGSSLPQRVKLHFVQTSSHKRDLSTSGRFSFVNIVSAMSDCLRFLIFVLKRRPHITHIGTAFGLSFLKNSVCILISRLLGCKVLLHPHCSFASLYLNHQKWWQWYFRQIVRWVHGVIALSSEWKRLHEFMPGCQIYILPNGINLMPYLAIACERFENPAQKDKVNILYLGYLGQAKGSFDLIQVAQQLDCTNVKVSFNLVGDELRPGEINRLYKVIAQADLRADVKIHSSVTGAEKLAYFNNADIFIFPSYAEGLPLAVIEAMASGLPIVATKVGGIPDLVQDGVNGLLVDPGCPEQLAVALERIITDDQFRQSMQEMNARKAREHYNIEQHVAGLVEIYAKCI
jgi:glycosyltransferase involved in cell wall biosynthesis